MRRWVALTVAGLLVGCQAASVGPVAGVDRDRLLADQVAALRVDEVRLDDDRLWIRFQGYLEDGEQEEEFLVSTSWSEEEYPEGFPPDHPVLPMAFEEPAEWPAQAELREVLHLDASHWDALQVELLGDLAPAAVGEGVAVRADRDDLLLYRDEGGQIHLVPLEEKPVSVRLVRHYAPVDLARLALEGVDQYLESQSRSDRQVLFTVGAFGTGLTPFLFVDLDDRYVFLLRVEGDVPDPGKLAPAARFASHVLMKSTVGSIVSNPFSTLHRLFFLVADNAFDLLHPATYTASGVAEIPPLAQRPPMDLEAWESRLDQILGYPARSGRLRFLIGGDEFFPRFIEAVLDAKDSVDIRTFLFDIDPFALRIADLLRRRAEDLRVRVLLDGVGSKGLTLKTKSALPAGVNTIRDYLAKDSDVAVRVQKSPLLLADHTKTMHIDREIVFTGGMNLGWEYRYDWHDLMIEVQGPVVDDLHEGFERRWRHSGFLGDFVYFFYRLFSSPPETPASEHDIPIRILETTPQNSHIYQAQRAAIRWAQRSIFIENPYLADKTFLRDLIEARRRGVDVRVVLPFSGNHGVLNRSNVITSNLLFANGVRVYFYPAMSHVKAGVYDGWACLGSANFDWLSFRRNRELNLATSDAQTVQELYERLFEVDFARSVEMTEPFPEKWSDQVARIIASRL